MITIDLICEACGEPNPPGTEFCRNCNAFLAWDSATSTRQPSTSTTATAATVPTPPVVEQPVPAVEQTVPITEQTIPNQAPVDAGYANTQAYDQQAYDQQGYDQQAYDQQAYVLQPPTEISCPYCGTVYKLKAGEVLPSGH